MKIKSEYLLFGLMIVVTAAWANDAQEEAQEKQTVKKIIFETQRIEGKIRRPQLVLIRAEQRPDIKPMLMQRRGDYDAIVDFVSESVIDYSPYEGAFKFSGQKIINYKP